MAAFNSQTVLFYGIKPQPILFSDVSNRENTPISVLNNICVENTSHLLDRKEMIKLALTVSLNLLLGPYKTSYV